MVDKPVQTISESLLEAYSLTWDMIRDSIVNIHGEHWRTGEIEYLTLSRLVLHVLEAADYYSNPSPDVYQIRFKIDRKSSLLEQLPTNEQLKAYLEEVQEKTALWLKGMKNSDLLSPETEYTWTGSTMLGRALYLLAHCRQHLGEVNAELRRRGLPRIKWRTF